MVMGPSRINALRAVADSAANTLLSGPGDHRVAIVKWDNILVGSMNFTNNYAAVNSSLMSMYAGGATQSTVGLAQAQALAAGARSDAVLAIVLLTDGLNNNFAVDNPASLAICNTLKAAPSNARVYSIAFGTHAVEGPWAPTIRQFLSDCASAPNGSANPAPAPNEGTTFYAAPNAAALNAAFVSIIGSIQKVRITE
jgi:hypothetical protein